MRLPVTRKRTREAAQLDQTLPEQQVGKLFLVSSKEEIEEERRGGERTVEDLLGSLIKWATTAHHSISVQIGSDFSRGR